VRNKRLFQRLLGLTNASVELVHEDTINDVVVVSVRPHRGERQRCGRCRRRSPLYDRGEGRRRWRSLDLGTRQVWLEADAPRVQCRVHGPTVAAVPWARHGAGHTRDFDDTVAWLAVQCSKTAVTELLRIAWRTVGAIIARVQADIDLTVDRFDGLRRIGIDEISYKRGHRYLTVVVDHDSGRLVWAAVGHDEETLTRFFAELGPDRCALITHVSADAATWIANGVRANCPNAVLCADAFHVVKWATDALDVVRRDAWRRARTADPGKGSRPRGRPRRDAPPRPSQQRAEALKHARYALWKNPENLTDRQTAKLAWIVKTDPRLYRAYLLKEGLRTVFKLKGHAGKDALDRWLVWACRCQIPAFVKLQHTIRRHRAEIEAALESNLSKALIESTNTKIRLLTRLAFGFKNPKALIALAMLALAATDHNSPDEIDPRKHQESHKYGVLVMAEDPPAIR
jgi:transposase